MAYKKNKQITFDKDNSAGPKNAFRLDAAYNRIFTKKSMYHNFHSGKNAYYGKIDGENNVVNVDEAFLKNIQTPDGEPILCLNFVADAFKDMRRYIKIEAARKVRPDDFINSGWDAKKAWSSPHTFYDQNIKDLYEIYVKETLLARGKEEELFNAKHFIKIFFNDFYVNIDRVIPITKTGMIMSKYYNPTSTGLCVETLKQDYSKVDETFRKIVMSTNYNFYLLSAAKFGFLVDQNAPWRLVANLNSPAMEKYMSMYGLTVDNVFKTAYIPTYRVDIEKLKRYMYQMYDAYTSTFPTVLQEITYNDLYSKCPPYKMPKYRESPRPKITYDKFCNAFKDLFWLKMYYKIKLKETKVNAPISMLDREILKVEEIYEKLDFDMTLEYINNQVKKQIAWV